MCPEIRQLVAPLGNCIYLCRAEAWVMGREQWGQIRLVRLAGGSHRSLVCSGRHSRSSQRGTECDGGSTNGF